MASGTGGDHPADVVTGPGRAGDAGKESLGAAPAWKQQQASRGSGGAGWVRCQLSGDTGGDGPSRTACTPSLSPLLHPASGGSLPACRHLATPSSPCRSGGWSILLPAASASLHGRRGCRGAERLPGPRRAASPLPGAAGLGIPGLAGSAGTHRHQGPPGRHLCAGAVPVTGTPGAGPYRTSHLALQPFIALPWMAARRHGALPSLRARWLIVIPWRWTPTGVACQG